MDYAEFQAILNKHGVSAEPAFEDPNFLVRIAPLPEEYSSIALGLYYPDEQRMWVPPESSEATILHELGHRHGHWHQNDISEPYAEVYRRGKMRSAVAMKMAPSHSPKLSSRPPAKQAGSYTEIVAVNAPESAAPGEPVSISTTIKNIYSDFIHIYVVGLVSTTRFIDWQEAWLQPGETQTFSGSFNMPDSAAVIEINVLYEGSEGETYFDTEKALRTINSLGAYQIPSTYTLQNYIIYPGAASHVGDEVSIATFGFTAPLTVIPGVDWLVDQMLGRFVQACVERNAEPLELRVYTEPAILGSTNYIVQAIAISNVAMRAPVKFAFAAIPPAAWVAIGVFLFGTFAFIYFETLAITTMIYGPKVTSTTTTQPQTKTLDPGQSFAVTSGAVPITAGSGGGTATDKDGKVTKVPPNGVVVLGPGGTFVAGSGGATANIPAQTTTTTGPSNPKGLDTTADMVKYVAIGLGVVAAALLGVAAIQAFGKRELYPIRA